MIAKKSLGHFLVFSLFSLITAVMTYPLVFKAQDHLIGFYGTDETFAGLWIFWWLKYSWLNGIPQYLYTMTSAPFGISYFPYNIFPLWHVINKWLTVSIGNIGAYNLQALFTFLAAGLTMYYLVRSLTKNSYSAVIAGVIFSFCPYHFIRAWQHLGLAQIQWMPLYLLSLFSLAKNPKPKNALIAAGCYYLVFAFDFHCAYFMFIASVVFFLWAKNRFKLIKPLVITAAVVLILISPVVFAIFKNTQNVIAAGIKAEYGFVRPFQDLFNQSARPLSYFLPAPVHPLFGKFTENFIGTSLYGGSLTEHVLYLGWVPLFLAFIAFRRWRRRVKNEERRYVTFFIFLALAAWLFSQPPWWQIGPLKIYMPSFFMYKILPMFRAYCRFGILLMLCVAVLAGFGLSSILERFKARKTKIMIASFFCFAVLFEFWNYPPFKVIDLSRTPAAYTWLKQQPGDFILAEYPIDTNGANVIYMFYQTRHEKRIINGTIPGTYPNKIAKSIVNLSDPRTAGVLKWLGVKYVFVHRGSYLKTELTELIEEFERISHNSGLKKIGSFPEENYDGQNLIVKEAFSAVDVYEVIAKPLKPEIKEK